MKFTGVVQKGEGRGKTLGFPTLNIPLEDSSLSGIYAALVTVKGATYHAAAYADTHHALLEAHLLDFDGDLYGEEAAIELVEKLREGRAFVDADEARRTINDDVQKARACFRMP